MKIEYSYKRENGDSRPEFWWQGPESYLPPLDANCAASPYEWCAGYRVAWNSPSDSYVLRRLEGTGYLDHDWGYVSPGYGIYDDFSAEWSRLARFDAGLYRFHTIHDDGVELSWTIKILNQWGTCCREDTVDAWVSPGDHRVTVSWFDSGGAANIKVWWERITPCYTLTLTTTPSGIGSVGANPVPNCPADGSKYTAGTNVTLVATPATPNDFVGWGGDVSGSAQSISLMMNADRQVTAGFVRCHALQLGSDPNGVIATNPPANCGNGTHYRVGTNIALYASASAGYQMDSWHGDLSGSTNPTVIVLDQNKSVSASFVTSSLPPPDAWRGEYFNNLTLSGSPSLVRYDAAINFSWQGDSPGPGIDPDFSARWTRQIDFAPGNYRFSLTHDDGIRLWIDDVLQLDQWGTCCRTDEIEVNLTEGPHLLRVEFVDTGGWAQATVDWALITPFSTTIDAIDPTPPYCVVRSAPTAYARTLTIVGENISTVDYHHLQFRNMDTGDLSIHFHQEIAWRSPTRAAVDFDRIKSMLWTDSKIRLSVRVTGPTYSPLSGWSPEFLLADYETACGSVRPAASLPEAPLVSASVNGNNLVLSWPDALANETYRVLRHTAPYFDPEASGPVLIGSANSNGTTANCSIGPQGVVCTDVGALTDPKPVTFYLVQALNAEGVPVSTSRVGRFSFSILSGQ